MSPQSKYFGFIRYSDCYHSSPDCPVIKHVMSSCEHAEVRDYPDEAKAIAAGHLRRCRMCLGDKVFLLRSSNERVHMSDDQYEALLIVMDIFKKSGPMTLRTISKKRNRSVVSTYLIVKKLRKDGLVDHSRKMGGKRASKGSIIPTKLGVEVCNTEALPDWREMEK